MNFEYKPLPIDDLEYRGGKEIGHVRPDRDNTGEDNNNQGQDSTNN
jgi:hypothetical protein